MKSENQIAGIEFRPIPRVLHQTWKDENIPERWIRFRDSWLEHHPGWEYRLWTDADNRNLVVNHMPEFLPVYDGFVRDIQRVDAAKILILLHVGGVYADLDTECLGSIDPLLETGGMVVSRTPDGVIDGAFLAAAPGHSLCRLALRQMASPSILARAFRPIYGLQATHVLLSTGPLMLRSAVRDYHRRLRSGMEFDGIHELDPGYCSSRSWWHRHLDFADSSQVRVRHHHSDSWLLPIERSVVSLATPRTLTLLLGASVIILTLALVLAFGR